jgi:hypothetical protein
MLRPINLARKATVRADLVLDKNTLEYLISNAPITGEQLVASPAHAFYGRC